MSNYMYAIDRSDDYLAHYGVRGMKWGVRKALARGDRAALSKHYHKAVRKLAKLSMQANRDVMKKVYKTARHNMIQGALSSAGLSAGLAAGVNMNRGIPAGEIAKTAGIAGLSAGLGGALLNSKGIMSRRYTSDRGHAKAVAKRDKFRKEIEETFKNTGIAPSAKEMRKFHNTITAISDQKDPKAYVQQQYAKEVGRSAKNVPTTTVHYVRLGQPTHQDSRADIRNDIRSRVGPGDKRIGYDQKTGMHYVDLRSNKKRAAQASRRPLTFDQMSPGEQRHVLEGLARIDARQRRSRRR